MERHDILTRGDIEFLIDSFYKKVIKDETIGFFFTEVEKLDLEAHMPTMYDFWESIIFQKPGYRGNPMQKHIALNAQHSIEKIHFDQWLGLFRETVDEFFDGGNAELAKTRALSIATMIQIKIHQNSSE